MIRKENIIKLEPAIQRANKIVHSEIKGSLGYLDHLLAYFMIGYTGMLMKRFPEETKSWKKKYAIYDFEEWQPMDYREDEYKEIMFEPHKQILMGALAKLEKQERLPLLSTPTNSPAWISSKTLVERLSEYESENKKPECFDLQVAISRCAFDDKTNAIKLAEERLTGEYRQLMLFLLTENAVPQGPFTDEAAWMVASVSKFPKQEYPLFKNFVYNKKNHAYLSGQYEWKTIVEQYTYNLYNYEKKKDEEVTNSRKIIKIEFVNKPKAINYPLPEEEKIIYNFVHIKADFIGIEHNDIQRLLLLTPNNPDPMLAYIIEKCLKNAEFFGEDSKRLTTKAAGLLHDIWIGFGGMAHLFVATCMISSEKTVRSFGAETWIKGVNHGNIKSELLGELLGKHERIEFAPLKRLTDLIMSNMLQISEKHNRELEVILVALLNQLPTEPIVNLKKLLELYSEVSSINGSSITDSKLIAQLNLWKKSAAVSKVIKGLEAKIR
jgi:hypothetical protein